MIESLIIRLIIGAIAGWLSYFGWIVAHRPCRCRGHFRTAWSDPPVRSGRPAFPAIPNAGRSSSSPGRECSHGVPNSLNLWLPPTTY